MTQRVCPEASVRVVHGCREWVGGAQLKPRAAEAGRDS